MVGSGDGDGLGVGVGLPDGVGVGLAVTSAEGVVGVGVAVGLGVGYGWSLGGVGVDRAVEEFDSVQPENTTAVVAMATIPATSGRMRADIHHSTRLARPVSRQA